MSAARGYCCRTGRAVFPSACPEHGAQVPPPTGPCPCCAGDDQGDVFNLCAPCSYVDALGLSELCRHEWPTATCRPPLSAPVALPDRLRRMNPATWRKR